MSFETMMARATDSTITIAVAAERPPTKAAMVKQVGMRGERQGQDEHVAVDLPGEKVSRPANAIGTTNRLISTR